MEISNIFVFSVLTKVSWNIDKFLWNVGELWHPRSLFISEGHLLVCTEDLKQFGSFSIDGSLPPYFSLDSCCLIADILEMVTSRSWLCLFYIENISTLFCWLDMPWDTWSSGIFLSWAMSDINLYCGILGKLYLSCWAHSFCAFLILNYL